MKRLEQAAGQADGLIETPGFKKPKVLVTWLTCYILFCIMYRWYFDKDDNNNPTGLAEVIQNGLMDFAGKGLDAMDKVADALDKKLGFQINIARLLNCRWFC